MTAAVGRYRKRPVEVEAVQWDGTAAGATPIVDWVLANGGTARYACVGHYPDLGCDGREESHVVAIDTLEGTMAARPRWWVLRGVRGEFYPCEDEIFAATYDLGDDEAECGDWPAPCNHDPAHER